MLIPPLRKMYTLFIKIYSLGIAIAALFNDKARLLYRGRRKTFSILKEQCTGKQIVWLHAASLGEYEQGKPLIQKMRAQHPEYTFLVTFFSPSGYEVKKNDKDIDIVAYLPADTRRNARRFLQTVKPVAAFFVKYEYWYNFIQELAKNQIPFYYLSAIYRPTQYFFKPYGKWFARQLKKCTHFFVQNAKSKDLLNQIGIEQVTITGDTRFDRVFTIAQQNEVLPFVEEFKDNGKLLVAGSTWQPDEQVLVNVFDQIKYNGYKLILAPHLIDKEHIESIKRLFKNEKVVCFSAINGQNLAEYNVLIIDAIGFLSKVYKYADVAHIGGAFATGLHNTLEAAVFGIPLFFGPHYSKFNEAIELVARKGAFSIHSAEEMKAIMQQFEDQPEVYYKTCRICEDYVKENLGACDKILARIRN